MRADEAARDLDALAATVESVELRQALEASALRVADIVAQDWPFATGFSRDSWAASGTAVVNTAPYTTHVHDGLVFALVPRIAGDDQPRVEADLERRIKGRVA